MLSLSLILCVCRSVKRFGMEEMCIRDRYYNIIKFILIWLYIGRRSEYDAEASENFSGSI